MDTQISKTDLHEEQLDLFVTDKTTSNTPRMFILSPEVLQSLDLKEKMRNENNSDTLPNILEKSLSSENFKKSSGRTDTVSTDNLIINLKGANNVAEQTLRQNCTSTLTSQIISQEKVRKQISCNSVELKEHMKNNISLIKRKSLMSNINQNMNQACEGNTLTNVTPVKRRGRPRKSDISQSSQQSFDVCSPNTANLPKGRGRPRKFAQIESDKTTENKVKSGTFENQCTTKTRRKSKELDSGTDYFENSNLHQNGDDLSSTPSTSTRKVIFHTSEAPVVNLLFENDNTHQVLSKFSEGINQNGNSDTEDTDSELKNEIQTHYGKRGRGRGRGRVRGRGRGRGKNRNYVDNVYAPGHKISGDIQNENNIFIPEIKLETVEGARVDELNKVIVKPGMTIKCGKCNLEMHKTQWYNHNLWKHNNLAWKADQARPDYDNDIKLLKKTLFDAIKRRNGQLVCDLCGEAKRSAMGFLSHLTFCGKSAEEKKNLLETCDICGAVMMPLSMVMHKRSHRSLEVTKTVDGVESTPEILSRKRRAAEKAVSKISEFTSAYIKEDEDESMKKPKVCQDMLKFAIQKPQMKKRMPGILKSIWNKEIKSTGMATCRQPGCEFTSETLKLMIDHYLTCNFTPRRNFLCRICNFHTMFENDIQRHVKENHSINDLDDKETDNFSVAESDESKDSNDDIDVGSDINVSFPVNKLKSFKAHARMERTLSTNKLNFMRQLNTEKVRDDMSRVSMLQWTMEFELKNYQLELFSDFEPGNFTLLNNVECNNYLPKVERSMPTKVQVNDMLDVSNMEWKCWEKFEGNVEGNVPAFFCGGPVWAMSWLPIPSPLYSCEVDQFLAVSVHPTMDAEYAVGQAYIGKNVIQIWNMGSLDNDPNKNPAIPTLSYAIAHEGETVWSLEWCPSGCYQDERLSNYENVKDKLRRMGLLAAACADGCIRIYSLVFPEELHTFKTEVQYCPVYKTKPVRILVLNYEIYKNGEQNWQCSKLCWSRERGHDTIAAGFTNGYVALWDVATQSPLLVTKQVDDSIFVDAFQQFYAHMHAVTMVALIPYAGRRFLATASLDRNYKLWDLENTNNAVTVTKRGIVVDGIWLTHWPCAAIAFDNAVSLNAAGSYLLPLREFEYKQYQLLNAGCAIYAIAASDFVNGLSEGTLAGNIYAMFPPQLMYLREIEISFPKTKLLCSSVTVIDFETSQTENTLNTEDKKKKKKSEEYNFLSQTYDECKSRFGLVFTDEVKYTYRKKGFKMKPVDTSQPINVEKYPFTSVNRLSWNPSVSGHLWLAAGYQNGLVRLLNFRNMAMPREVDRIMTEHVPEFIRQIKQEKLGHFSSN